MNYAHRYDSPIGPLVLASDGTNIVGLWMEGQKYFGGTVAGTLAPNPGLHVFSTASQWLDDYFAGRNPDVSALLLAPNGSLFQKAVWRQLLGIPYGKTATYGDIAKKVAAEMKKTSMSGQAVGGAVGHNPISVIIPCHRVVGSNGSLTGYAGGLQKKINLLTLEGADMSRLLAPRKGTAL
jgi:methylated-DNA-[protein]-cysteine S-methyltransferase